MLFRSDNGMAARLNATAVPALYLTAPATRQIVPVGFGVMSMTDLVERIAALAQDALETVTVTARKRVETLQDVPVAVSVTRGAGSLPFGSSTSEAYTQRDSRSVRLFPYTTRWWAGLFARLFTVRRQSPAGRRLWR